MMASIAAVGTPMTLLHRTSWRKNDDGRAHLHAAVEIDHVLVGQADAAGRNGLADVFRLVGAVNAVERVLPVLVKINAPGSQRVARAAGDVRRVWAEPLLNVGRGNPVGPLRQASDLGD